MRDVSFVLDKDESHIHTGSKIKRREEDGCSVDRQYEYFSSGASHRHGFLCHSSGQHADSVAKKGVKLPLRISDCGISE